MSMPSYWFDPFVGGSGGSTFGGTPNVAPAMSANQINASMWGNYSPGAAQATSNNIYGGGGFGAQPAAYAAAGAAYGRATGGFGGYAPSTPAATSYPEFGYGGDSQGIPIRDPWTGAITGYNAPRQYGWDANEGAAVPSQPEPFQRGMFRPQTYGWDHNEGATYTPPTFNDIWSGRGAQSLARDNLFNTYAWPTPQPQLDFLDRGGFGMNLPNRFNPYGNEFNQ